jgi:hypothetical protein
VHVYPLGPAVPFLQPILGEFGIQGNENDAGAYQLTRLYQHPDEYLLPNHQGLFDGVFKQHLHCQTDKQGILPAAAAELARAPTLAARNKLKKYNRVQRRLRVVIEQTFGMIKQWGLVGNTVYRGDLELQGINFLLCTMLTAWLMESRDSYPRGKKWQNDQLEEWERSMEQWLEIDPLYPDLY